MKIISIIADQDFKRMRAGYETIAEKNERLSRRDSKGRWMTPNPQFAGERSESERNGKLEEKP